MPATASRSGPEVGTQSTLPAAGAHIRASALRIVASSPSTHAAYRAVCANAAPRLSSAAAASEPALPRNASARTQSEMSGRPSASEIAETERIPSRIPNTRALPAGEFAFPSRAASTDPSVKANHDGIAATPDATLSRIPASSSLDAAPAARNLTTSDAHGWSISPAICGASSLNWARAASFCPASQSVLAWKPRNIGAIVSSGISRPFWIATR